MQYPQGIKRRTKPIGARTIGLRVTQDEYQFVKNHCDKTGLTFSEVLEQSLKLYFGRDNLTEKGK